MKLIYCKKLIYIVFPIIQHNEYLILIKNLIKFQHELTKLLKKNVNLMLMNLAGCNLY